MNFTGSELIKKRNFYQQSDNYGIVTVFNLDNPSGRYEFGVSGDSKVSLVLESGLIKYENLTLFSYDKYKNYAIEINCTNDKVNIKNNDEPLAMGLTKPTGQFNYFYFQRENDLINANFEFIASGSNKPIYEIDKIGYLLTTGQRNVNGFFRNYGSGDIKIFETYSRNTRGLNYKLEDYYINSGENAEFGYSGSFRGFNFSQPIYTTFQTNFGQVDLSFKIVNASEYAKLIIFDEIESFGFDPDNEINRILSWTNYSGGVETDQFNTRLSISLEYVDGSGAFAISDFASNVNFTGIGYENIFGSGFVTGVSRLITGAENVTGYYEINFNRFQWATGAVTGYFSGFGTGIASGIGYTGVGYGAFTGFATGIIFDGSGTIISNDYFATGFPVGEFLSVDYTGYENATGYLTLSGAEFRSVFYIGVESDPIIYGVQFNDINELSTYLNSNQQHKVFSLVNGDKLDLSARVSGENGNGIFIRNNLCEENKLTNFSEFLTGGQNIGNTGISLVSITNLVSGNVQFSATGSGDYSVFVSSQSNGIFYMERTFTGAWDFYTGLSNNELARVQTQNELLYSGDALLPPNSSLVFSVNHNESEYNIDSARLRINGSGVINPINQTIIQ